MTDSILKKWRAQGSFLRFKDGDQMNCSVRNLEYVSLKDAMDNIDEWTVDWDMNLTPKEISLVKTPEWRAGLEL